MNAELLIAIAVWWTFAVACVAIIVAESGRDHFWITVAVSVFWPITAIVLAVVMLWHVPFRTAKAIRRDIRNRGLSREFEAWLKSSPTTGDSDDHT